MRVHHFNCGTMCPVSARLVNGEGSLFGAGRMVCHCLALETKDGLALVDTGLGTEDLADPVGRLGRMLVTMMRPSLDREETAVAQLARGGWKPSDVRHVVPTHLDLDHAGGLADFPRATVHVFADEHDAAMRPRNLAEKERYRRAHFAHGPLWRRLTPEGERWMGFDAVRALGGTDDEVLLVPTIGHTRGHCAVAVRTAEGWLLHAGDAYFFHEEMNAERPWCTPFLAAFQRIAAVDDHARRRNRDRLRALANDRRGEVKVICAHSPVELAALQSISGTRPRPDGASPPTP